MLTPIPQLELIKAVLFDVDGVMTDGRVFFQPHSGWTRFFHIHDGVGIKRLIKAGYTVGVITGSQTMDIQERIKLLGIPHFYQGALEKSPAFEDFKSKTGFQDREIAYLGDDDFDLPILTRVGFGATVPNAVPVVIEKISQVTQFAGGAGAVREFCDLILNNGAFRISAGAK